MKLWNCMLAIGLALTTALPAAAQSPAASSVQPADALGTMVLCPDLPNPIPASIQTITVVDASGAVMPNVSVRVIWSNRLTPCSSAVLNGVTNNQGQVQLTMAGGGCDLSPNAVQVIANGVLLRSFPAKSPDFDGAGGDLQVNLADLTYLGSCLPGCTHFDFDGDGMFGLADLVILTPPFLNQNFCP